MGDRTWLNITIAKKDLPKFNEILYGELTDYNYTDEDDKVVTFFIDEANYAWEDELQRCAEAGLIFTADHGSGDCYDSGSYAAFDGRLYHVETNFECTPCVPWHEDGPDLDIKRDIEKFYKICIKIDTYFKQCSKEKNEIQTIHSKAFLRRV